MYLLLLTENWPGREHTNTPCQPVRCLALPWDVGAPGEQHRTSATSMQGMPGVPHTILSLSPNLFLSPLLLSPSVSQQSWKPHRGI